MELGATDFLNKPVNATELVPRVAMLMVKVHHDCLRHYAEALECQARQLEAQIAQARTDALTGLANRRAPGTKGPSPPVRRVPAPPGSPLYAVMLLDVDHFKSFND